MRKRDRAIHRALDRLGRGLLAAAAVSAVAGALAGASGASAASSAAVKAYCVNQHAVFRDPHPFMGTMDGLVDTDSPQLRDCTFGRMAANHIGYFRETISWAAVESVPHQYDFSVYDAVVSSLARHHMRLLPLLLGAPDRLSTRPSHGALPELYPPRRADQFAYFASLCVQRYGPHGSFWRTHPELPYYPVQAWEVWNEPNLSLYWAPKPDPAAYVRLLKASATAIRHVDPHATIVLAGMPFFNAPAEGSFLTTLYKDGARNYFNALGLHTYSVTVGGSWQRLQTARAVMNRFGDRAKGIWLTEWGWAGGPPNPYIVSASGQKQNVSAFLALIQRYRRSIGLSEVMYFDWRDNIFAPAPKNYWIFHLGLITLGLQPKPALATVSAAAKTLDR